MSLIIGTSEEGAERRKRMAYNALKRDKLLEDIRVMPRTRQNRSSPFFHHCARVRGMAAVLTTLDFSDDPRGLGQLQLTF